MIGSDDICPNYLSLCTAERAAEISNYLGQQPTEEGVADQQRRSIGIWKLSLRREKQVSHFEVITRPFHRMAAMT